MTPTLSPHGPARTVLVPATLVATGAGLVCTAVATVLEGADGLLAALVGTGLVVAFLLVGQAPVAQVARGRKVLGTALLVLGYTARISLLLIAFRLLSGSTALDRDVLGVTVVVCALAWTAGAVVAYLRWRPMYVEPGPAPDEAPPLR